MKQKGRSLRTLVSGGLEVLVSDLFLYSTMLSYLLFTSIKFSTTVFVMKFLTWK